MIDKIENIQIPPSIKPTFKVYNHSQELYRQSHSYKLLEEVPSEVEKFDLEKYKLISKIVNLL